MPEHFSAIPSILFHTQQTDDYHSCYHREQDSVFFFVYLFHPGTSCFFLLFALQNNILSEVFPKIAILFQPDLDLIFGKCNFRKFL